MKKLSFILAALLAFSAVVPTGAEGDLSGSVHRAVPTEMAPAEEEALDEGAEPSAEGDVALFSTEGSASVVEGDTEQPLDGSDDAADAVGNSGDESASDDDMQIMSGSGEVTTSEGEGAEAGDTSGTTTNPDTTIVNADYGYYTPGGANAAAAFDGDTSSVFTAAKMSDDYGCHEQYLLFYLKDANGIGRRSVLNSVTITATSLDKLKHLKIQGSDDMCHWQNLCVVTGEYNDGASVTVTTITDNRPQGIFELIFQQKSFAFYRLVSENQYLEVAELNVSGTLDETTNVSFETATDEENGIHYLLNHYTGEALVDGYEDTAITAEGKLYIPKSYTVKPASDENEAVTYPVTALLTNSLSIANQAGYYERQSDWANQDEADVAIADYAYEELYLPETIKFMAHASVGGEHFHENRSIRYIHLPFNEELDIEGEAILKTMKLADLHGPAYGNATYRYQVYTDINGGELIYDSRDGRVMNYTTGNGAQSFNLTIPDVCLQNNTFYGAENLRTVTLNSFTEIGNAAFGNCVNLTTVELGKATLTVVENDTDIDIEAYIDNNAFSGSRKLREITIPAGVDTIGQYAFEDWCGCGNGTAHNAANHEYRPGQLKVIFEDSTPPAVVDRGRGEANLDELPYNNVTIVCGDNCVSAYKTSSLFTAINANEVISLTDYNNPKIAYEWEYGIDVKKQYVHIEGITIHDENMDSITIPSVLEGYPVLDMGRNAFADIPEGTTIYNNNVYRLGYQDEKMAGRVTSSYIESVVIQNADNQDIFRVRIADEENVMTINNQSVTVAGYASIQGYFPAAIADDELKIPETVTHEGKTYKVVAILENALSPANAIGFDEEGYNASYDNVYWHDLYNYDREDEVMSAYNAHTFRTLHIPNTVTFIDFHSIGGEHFYDNTVLNNVTMPQNPYLFIDVHAFMATPFLTRLDNMVTYNERADHPDLRYFLYAQDVTDEQGNITDRAAIIYDKVENKVFRYTGGSRQKEFTLNIPDVALAGESFAWTPYLEKVTISSFRKIDFKSFAFCASLKEIVLNAADSWTDNGVVQYPRIKNHIVTDSWVMERIYINGQVDIHQRAFERDENRFLPGSLLVYLDTETPPTMTDLHPDSNFVGFPAATFVCKDAYINNYRTTDGNPVASLEKFFLNGVMTETEAKKYIFEKYQLIYERNDATKESTLVDVIVTGTFNREQDTIILPSYDGDYPVTKINGNALRHVPGNVRVVTTNVFCPLRNENWNLYYRIEQDHGEFGGRIEEVYGFTYYIRDEDGQKVAGLMGYDPSAVDKKTGTLTVPETVVVAGGTYTVIAIQENGVSPYNAAGIDPNGWCEDLQGSLDDNEEVRERYYDAAYYHLVLPDSVQYMSSWAVGEGLWNHELETIKLPNNPNLSINYLALQCLPNVNSYTGLPVIDSMDDLTGDAANYRTVIYENNGAQILYDRGTGSIHSYTSGSTASTFNVNITDVTLVGDAFSCSPNLRKVTVSSFAGAYEGVFNACESLMTIELTASANVESDLCSLGEPAKLQKLIINGDLDKLNYFVLPDWVDCYIYFNDPTPPEVYWYEGQSSVSAATLVVPEEYLNDYKFNENFQKFGRAALITSESLTESDTPYTWDYYLEHGEAILRGITFGHNFDPDNDQIVIPSYLGGKPVTWVCWGAINDNVPENIPVYSANIFAMRYEWGGEGGDEGRIDFETEPNGYEFLTGTSDNFHYFAIKNKEKNEIDAAITGYTVDALVKDVVFQTSTLSVPGTVTIDDGTSVKVVSIWPNALAPVYNAGYTYGEQLWEAIDSGVNTDNKIDPYLYTDAELPNNLIQIAEYALGSTTYWGNGALQSVTLPGTPGLVMYERSIYQAGSLTTIQGLREYSEECLTKDNDEYNFYLYKYEDTTLQHASQETRTAMGIYDQSRRSFMTYTLGSPNKVFELNIYDIWIMDHTFDNARNLEVINIGQFRTIGRYAFSDCHSLRELNLTAVQGAEIQSEFIARSHNLTEITIPAEVTKMSKYAFHDWCAGADCLRDNGWENHDPENHDIAEGSLQVYFLSSEPPQELYDMEDWYIPYRTFTAHVPEGSEDAYANVLRPMNYFQVQTHIFNKDVYFRIEEVQGIPGETVSVGVYVTTNVEVNTLVLSNLTYNLDGLELQSFKPILEENVKLPVYDHQQGYVALGFEEPCTLNDALLFTIEFKVKEADVERSITFGDVLAKNTNQEYTNIAIIPGSVIPYILGDIDGDGKLSVNDPLCIVRYIAQEFDESYLMGYPGSLDFDDVGGDAMPNFDDALYLFTYYVENYMIPNIANPIQLFPNRNQAS